MQPEGVEAQLSLRRAKGEVGSVDNCAHTENSPLPCLERTMLH